MALNDPATPLTTVPTGDDVPDVLVAAPSQADYFSTNVTWEFTMPDGESVVEHRKLTEGHRRKFLKDTSRDVRVSQKSQDAHIAVDPGAERTALLSLAIVGWNFIRDGKPVHFTSNNLKAFIDGADPDILELIEKDVRKQNPWLNSNIELEDVEREIAELNDLADELRAKEEGKAP